MDEITIDDFAKCDIRIGTILSAEIVEGSDKLIKFKIDLGEKQTNENGEVVVIYRQILSGVREYFSDIEKLIGRQVPVLANLKPRTIRGHISEGMILYAVGEGSSFTTITASTSVPSGTPVQ